MFDVHSEDVCSGDHLIQIQLGAIQKHDFVMLLVFQLVSHQTVQRDDLFAGKGFPQRSQVRSSTERAVPSRTRAPAWLVTQPSA